MKRVILCIEDDIYKTACMKNCAEAGFHLEVRISETSNEIDLLEKVITSDADEILYLPHEGVEAFMARLKRGGATRLNTEVRILLCQQFESMVSKVVRETVTEFARMSKAARSKLRRSHAHARANRECGAENATGAEVPAASSARDAGVGERGHLVKKRECVLKQTRRHGSAAAFA